MNRRMALALLAGASAIGLVGCGASGKNLPTYRYRLTVEVETPEGLKSGLSVIEVSTATAGRYTLPTPGSVSHIIRGEAVFVDLGSRGSLFALLRSDDNPDWAGTVMFRLAPRVPHMLDENGKLDGDRYFEARFAAMLQRSEPIALPKTFPDAGHLKDQPARPMLVRFRDITDPKTIEKVDPDDLAKSFGPGIQLKRITVQLTADPMTAGIENKLGWLSRFESMNLHASDFPEDIPVGDFLGLFRKGID